MSMPRARHCKVRSRTGTVSTVVVSQGESGYSEQKTGLGKTMEREPKIPTVLPYNRESGQQLKLQLGEVFDVFPLYPGLSLCVIFQVQCSNILESLALFTVSVSISVSVCMCVCACASRSVPIFANCERLPNGLQNWIR